MKRGTMLIILCLPAVSLACNQQINWTNEGQARAPVAPLSPTAAAVSSPTRATATNPVATSTLRPTRTLTPRVVFTPSMTGTPTNTAPPPLPDFPDVLTFGGGGGGADCERAGFPPGPYAVSMLEVDVGAAGTFCATIWRPSGGAFRLELISPAGPILSSPDLVHNSSSRFVDWPGYPGFGVPAQRTSDGTVFAQFTVWWPLNWPLGEWRAHVYGGESIADLIFWAVRDSSHPSLMALDERTDRALMPSTGAVHPLRPNADGSVDVLGLDYPPKTQVFLLLYRMSDYQATLAQKMGALSNDYGSVHARLPGPLEPGVEYMLFGLTDANTPLGGGVTGCGHSPCDIFMPMP